MFKKNVPKEFWDYGLRWVCETMSRTHTRINGGIPLQKVTGETVDISNYLEFRFYDTVAYRENAGLSEAKIGRWLGVAKNAGLTQTAQVVAMSSVERVKEIEKRTEEMKRKLEEFDMEIKDRLKFDGLGTDGDQPDPHQWADILDVDPDFREEFLRDYQVDDINMLSKSRPLRSQSFSS
jgi:hypothetical protein